MTNGIKRITAERERQVSEEGWTPKHDDHHASGELAVAAACYALHAANRARYASIMTYRAEPPPPNWPWDAKWWKPKNPHRDLERAGALIAAEIDRLDRAYAEKYAASMSDKRTEEGNG